MTDAIQNTGKNTAVYTATGRHSAQSNSRTSFAGQLDQALAIYERKFQDNLRTEHESLSPYCLMMEDYRKWEARQPPRILPDSRGETGENLAYLQDRYSGELSLFQRIEALRTLRDMGIFSQEQYAAAMGIRMVRVDPSRPIATVVSEPGSEPWAGTVTGQWLEHFRRQQILLAESNTLDDLFAWLDAHRDSDSLSVFLDSV